MAVAAIEQPHRPSLRAPVGWGLAFGGLQAASPLAFWWLDPQTVYAVGLVLIASVYIGFAVADGPPRSSQSRAVSSGSSSSSPPRRSLDRHGYSCSALRAIA